MAVLTFSLDYGIAPLEHLLMLHRRNRRKELTKNHLDATPKDRNLDKRILSCGCKDSPDKLRSWLTTEIDSPAKIALTIICSLRLTSEGDRSRYANSCNSSTRLGRAYVTRTLSLCGGWIEMG
jgi:hypothetical protein